MSGDLKLKQSNKLILATHKMDIQQLRLFFYACSKYRGELDINVPIADLYSVLAYQSGGQRELLNKAIPKMMSSALVHIDDEKGERWSVVITDSFISKDGKSVHFTFNKSVKKELDEIEKYTWMYLENLTGMSSIYAVRLYEFFVMRLGSQNKKGTFDYDMERLRNYLDCSDKYPRFETFDRKVLKVAQEQINEKTNIHISYKKVKTKQKITSIKFSFKWKSSKDIVDVKHTVHDPNEPLEGQTSLEDYGVKVEKKKEQEEVFEMLKKYD